MLNLGAGEIVLLAVIALVVMGPEKFPEFAKIALRAFRDLRRYVDDIKHEMAEELNPIKRDVQQLAKANPEQYLNKLAQAITSEPSAPAPAETPPKSVDPTEDPYAPSPESSPPPEK